MPYTMNPVYKITKTLLLLFFPIILSAQKKFSAFKDFTFDSSYSIVSIQSSTADINTDDQENCFFVTQLDELLTLQKNWVIKKPIGTLSFEAKSITIFIAKDKKPIRKSLMIFPRQGIINYDNSWYEFDMNLYKNIQKSHPLTYYSRYFPFETYYEFELFKDSLQLQPNVIMIMEPSAQKFEGSFQLISPRPKNDYEEIKMIEKIKQEFAAEFPKEKFDVSYAINSPFNIANTDKLMVTVNCSKNLYDLYKPTARTKEDWMPFRFIGKVFFLK